MEAKISQDIRDMIISNSGKIMRCMAGVDLIWSCWNMH
jgi:hypothetical protein